MALAFLGSHHPNTRLFAYPREHFTTGRESTITLILHKVRVCNGLDLSGPQLSLSHVIGYAKVLRKAVSGLTNNSKIVPGFVHRCQGEVHFATS